MQTITYRSEDRGTANHGWLQAKHSFSFGNFYNPNLMHFGVLRVLNDDIIEASMGFGTHPHDNMEIITIPLQGALAHKDSMGHSSVIKAGEIQVMSAGTGIQHSEYNALDDQSINLLQIWLFPNKRNVTPRYDQQQLNTADMHNNWSQILSPSADDQGVWIHQDAWFHMGEFEANTESSYTLKDPSNGLYVFVIEGGVAINNLTLSKRDAAGITQSESVPFRFTEKSKVLLLEVPMS
jgi:quercetin 2,3-dioxygenase